MKRCLLLLLCASVVFAQTDAPPELDQPFAPESMPPVEVPITDLDGKLLLVFEGNLKFTEGQLRKEIARQVEPIEQFGLDDASAYDAAFFVESFYRRRGYSQVVVIPQIVGAWTLSLTINEGTLTRFGTISIVGNEAFDSKTFSDYLLGPVRENHPRIRVDTDLPFVEADLEAGVDLVRRLYASGGYLNAEVERPEISFRDDNTAADIELVVHEGMAYRFGSIQLAGEIVFPEEEVLDVIANLTGDVYSDGRLAAAARALEDFYKRRGYFQVAIVPQAEPDIAYAGTVPTKFAIEPGEKFRFGGTTIEGLEGVRPSFVEKRMRRLRGQVYHPSLIDKTFRELIQTGLFRTLRITPEAIAGDEVRLDLVVEEALPKEFGVGIGYASFFGGIVSASYRDLNFLRSGRTLRLEVEANQRGYSGLVQYKDPWLFDSDYELLLELLAETSERKGYSKNEVGFRPTLLRAITDKWEISAFLSARHVVMRNILIEPISLVGLLDYSVFSIGISQTLDYRNNIALPTRGFIFTTTAEVAPSHFGDVAYFRVTGNFTWYLPITAKSTLALGARAGVTSPLGTTGLPIDERFFSGGATTVRSFSEFSLGPRDSAGYPLGGEARTIFNAEYSFPIFGDLVGAVFIDAGNVVSRAADFGFEDMRYAVGAGLRYKLPIGAIRLDYGLNPRPQQGEAQGAFHFAIGVAF